MACGVAPSAGIPSARSFASSFDRNRETSPGVLSSLSRAPTRALPPTPARGLHRTMPSRAPPRAARAPRDTVRYISRPECLEFQERVSSMLTWTLRARLEARLYADRAAGGDRHHRHPDRPARAGRAEGARGRRPHPVRQQHEAAGPGDAQLQRQLPATPAHRSVTFPPALPPTLARHTSSCCRSSSRTTCTALPSRRLSPPTARRTTRGFTSRQAR